MSKLYNGKDIIFLLAALLLTPVVAYAQQVHWPQKRKAAIVLTYDDGLHSQLNNVVPALLKSGIKATFYLTSDMDSTSIPVWRGLAQ